jgi:hypothetical protein
MYQIHGGGDVVLRHVGQWMPLLSCHAITMYLCHTLQVSVTSPESEK